MLRSNGASIEEDIGNTVAVEKSFLMGLTEERSDATATVIRVFNSPRFLDCDIYPKRAAIRPGVCAGLGHYQGRVSAKDVLVILVFEWWIFILHSSINKRGDIMKTDQATAEVFFTAFKALKGAERAALIEGRKTRVLGKTST